MSKANIVHSGYGLRCEKLDKPLNLSWGLDNSAVLHCHRLFIGVGTRLVFLQTNDA